LCFERRFSKQNSVIRLKSNIYAPSNFWAGYTTVTQASLGSQTIRSRPVAFYNIALRHRSRVHICISKGNYRKISCLGEHNTQGT